MTQKQKDNQCTTSSKFKTMLIVFFFDIREVVKADWVPTGQTVNQHNYIEILAKSCGGVKRKRLGLW